MAKEKPTKLFFVWNDEDAENDPDSPYFEQYDTLVDAVSSRSRGEPVEVFLGEVKSIGFHKLETKVVKQPRKKKR